MKINVAFHADQYDENILANLRDILKQTSDFQHSEICISEQNSDLTIDIFTNNLIDLQHSRKSIREVINCILYVFT